MSRPKKIALIVAVSMAGLAAVLLLAAILVVQTGWFRNFVRERIVAAIETGTGGRAHIGSFDFSSAHLRADIRDLVIHGTEGPNDAPLLRARHVQVVLHLLSPFRGFIELAHLLVDTPQANVIVYPDGRTNVPSPKIRKQSEKSALETIVDLAVRRFDLRDGSLTFGDRKAAFEARGENLRAQLSYDTLNPRYTGNISIAPLYLRSGANPPLNVNVNLPLTLEKDRITLTNATIATPQSQVTVSGSMDHLVAPRVSARLNARISLAEARQAAGVNLLPLQTGPGLPQVLTADVNAYLDDSRVEVKSAHVALGKSTAEAAGMLKEASGKGSLRFNIALNLGEVGRMLRLAAGPEGLLRADGAATLRGASEYRLSANVVAYDLSFKQDGKRIGGINLDAALYADPRLIEAKDLRLAALGGSFNGHVSLEIPAHYRVAGNLSNFNLQEIAGAFMPRRLPYDGIVSGPIDASGDLHKPADLRANARLSIAPGRRGIPVSGRIDATYDGAADNVALGRSFLSLPSTRLDVSGSLGRRLQIRLVSKDLDDLRPAIAAALKNSPRQPAVSLERGGTAVFTGIVTGKLSAPDVSGHLDITNFAVQGRSFTHLAADLQAASTDAAVRNASLSHGALEMRFAASVGLQDWSPAPRQPLAATLHVRNSDLNDVLALAGKGDLPVTGSLAADARISGTVGDPRGDLTLTTRNGTAWQEPYRNISMRALLSEGRIDVPVLEVVSGDARLTGGASYLHARDDLRRGTLTAHLATNTFSLGQFQTLVKDRPGLGGTLHLAVDASVNVWNTPAGEQFQITRLIADAGVNGLRIQGRDYGDFIVRAHSAGPQLVYEVNSNFAGSTIRLNGQTLLAAAHETSARVDVANLPIQDVLAIAGRRDIDAAGILGAEATLSGTLADPHAAGTFTVANGKFESETFDRLQASVNYSSRLIDVPDLMLAAGPGVIRASVNFVHPPNDLREGQLHFHVDSKSLQLARLQMVQRRRPGLTGTLKLTADGTAALRRAGTPRVLFSRLNANLSATDLNLNRKALGDVSATAATRGSDLIFHLKSNLGGAEIRGDGTVQLAGDYPAKAQFSFSDVKYSELQPVIGAVLRPGVDASMKGRADLAGPAARPEDLGGTLRLSRLEMHSFPVQGGPTMRRNISVNNAGPVVVTLNQSVVEIRSAHLVGPYVDLTLTGTAQTAGAKTLNLRADGNMRLELVEAFEPNVFASGSAVLHASVQGNISKPDVNGQLTLRDASLNLMDVPNGLSDANGTIVFNGTSAMVENVTGTTGGGKLTLSGFVGYGGPELQFRLTAAARRVRIQATPNVSGAVNANLDLSGSTNNSLLSGNVTILDAALVSHTDIGSVLSETAAPAKAPVAGGPLNAMRLDVRVRTVPDIQVRTSLTENLALDAQVTVRGTAAHPGMLGRVSITEGEVVFFGSKYTVDQGSVAFCNPQDIEPILNIDLSTTVKGVDVALNVTGPVDRIKLSYHSDPPLQFSDLVSLLATGRVPTTDPVLAAHQPATPEQNLEQKGASTVLGQAVANPVSGRLQRLFGVTKLKIDPQITGAANTPQARLTLQQQITKDLTFTYIQDVTQSNPQIIQVEWTIDPAWSAIAQRDVSGEFALDFFYKKRFR